MRIPGIPYVQGRNDYPDYDGKKYGIAIHNTSNDASDEGEASYATRRTDGISSHLYADDDSVTQSLDTESRAGHAGSKIGNENSIAVEITGANANTREWWLANVAWDKLGYALAYVITHDPDYIGFQVRRATVTEMKSNPRIKAFYGHNDMRLAWGGTTHTDPGPNFPWDRLFQAVNKYLAPSPLPVPGSVSQPKEDRMNQGYVPTAKPVERFLFNLDGTPKLSEDGTQQSAVVGWASEPIMVLTPWDKSSISFGCDFGRARLRVAEHEVNGGWKVHDITISSSDNHRLDLPARGNIDRRTVLRTPIDRDDAMQVPVSWLVWW